MFGGSNHDREATTSAVFCGIQSCIGSEFLREEDEPEFRHGARVSFAIATLEARLAISQKLRHAAGQARHRLCGCPSGHFL